MSVFSLTHFSSRPVSGKYTNRQPPKMWIPKFLIVSVLPLSALVEATALLEALKSAGASEFASRIESDPTVAAVFSSSDVQTVFAPIDGSVSPTVGRGKRQTNNQDLLYHGIKTSNKVGDLSEGSGKKLESNDKTANLDGAGQAAVSNPLNVTQSTTAKRWVGPIQARNFTNSTSKPLLKIFTGLGNDVNIIQGDIPYDGGFIQVVDSYFTLPEALSTTAIANGHTTFARLDNASGNASILDNTPTITCFIPSNAAFSASNGTSNYASSASLISGHIIPNFVGYLPSLENGAVHTTQGGTNVTITVQGNDYFVNNAKIIASNQILTNGVAHVIDSIIVPPTPTPVPFTGSASTLKGGNTRVAGMVLSALVAILAGF